MVDQAVFPAVALLTLRTLEGALTCVQGARTLELQAHKALNALQDAGGSAPHGAC